MHHPARTQIYIKNGYNDFNFSIIKPMSAWDLIELIESLAPQATKFTIGYPDGQIFYHDI